MKTNQKGFTLIELMIVVAIIGILASVGLPSYQSYISKAKGSGALQQLGSFRLDVSEFWAVEGQLPSVDNADIVQTKSQEDVTVTMTARLNDAGTGIFFICETNGTPFKNCSSPANIALFTTLQNAISEAAAITVGAVVPPADPLNPPAVPVLYTQEDLDTANAAIVTAQAAYDAVKTYYDS
jgi:type IV pilus assembly protein PilA